MQFHRRGKRIKFRSNAATINASRLHNWTAVGIDMGGTWVRAAVVQHDGQILTDVSICRTPNGRSAQERAPVNAAMQFVGSPIEGVGLAIAGIVKNGTLIEAANLKVCGFDFRSEIAARVPAPVSVMNDAQAAALAEATYGVGRGARTFVYVSIGTGIGGAIINNGRIVDGSGSSGEFGHMILLPEGPACGCGAAGCWEQFSSGNALGKIARHLLSDTQTAVSGPERFSSSEVGARELFALARTGNPDAHSIVRRAADFTVRGLRNIAVALDPDLIALGGAIPRENAEFWGAVEREFAEQKPRWTSTRLVRSELANGGIVGSALAAVHGVSSYVSS
jgi:glucokinase